MGTSDDGPEPLNDPSGRDDVMKVSRESVPDGELLHEDTRVVQNLNGGIMCNLTNVGAKVHDLNEGIEVNVATYADCIIITTRDDE